MIHLWFDVEEKKGIQISGVVATGDATDLCDLNNLARLRLLYLEW